MAIVTLVLSIYVGDSSLGREHASMLAAASRITYIVFSVICVAGIFSTLAGKNRK
jgi:hypothetical protein